MTYLTILFIASLLFCIYLADAMDKAAKDRDKALKAGDFWKADSSAVTKRRQELRDRLILAQSDRRDLKEELETVTEERDRLLETLGRCDSRDEELRELAKKIDLIERIKVLDGLVGTMDEIERRQRDNNPSPSEICCDSFNGAKIRPAVASDDEDQTIQAIAEHLGGTVEELENGNIYIRVEGSEDEADSIPKK